MDLLFKLSAFGALCLLCGGTSRLPSQGSGIRLTGSSFYSTVERRVENAVGPVAVTGLETADTTPHAVALEVASVRPAGLGAGTPAFELAAGVLVGSSHTEGKTAFGLATGNGRAESYALSARVPLGSGSIEGALDIPYSRSHDFLSQGAPRLDPERREVSSYTTNLGLGYRLRGPDWETALALRYAYTFLKQDTARSLDDADGPLFGAEFEARRRFGLFESSLAAGFLAGRLDSARGEPGSPLARSRVSASRAFVRVAAGRKVGRARLDATLTWSNILSPYGDAAPLSLETLLRDAAPGFSTRSDDLVLEIGANVPIRPSLDLVGCVLLKRGFERTSLADESLEVRRTGFALLAGFRAFLP